MSALQEAAASISPIVVALRTERAVLDAASVGHENVSSTISEGIRNDISSVG
jgi:hypothetical protein